MADGQPPARVGRSPLISNTDRHTLSPSGAPRKLPRARLVARAAARGCIVQLVSPSPAREVGGDLSGLGSRERNSALPKAARSRERERPSHWAGVR